MENSKPLTIIIPAFNEEQGITSVLNDLKKLPVDFIEEIIVVNDGSTDNTAGLAEEIGVTVLHHHKNQGYGASIKTGIRHAHSPFIITFDADGQHNPADIARLWEAVEKNDMVVGKRTSLMHSPAWRMPGKWVLGWLANYLSRQKIPDLNSGLRLIRRETALKYIHLCPSGFSFSTTITMTLLNRGYNINFVPIEVNKRTGKSTVSINSGFDTFILILRLAALFNPLRFFLPASMVIAAVGVIWGIPYALRGFGVSIGALLAIMTGIQLFFIGILCDQISQLRLERFE